MGNLFFFSENVNLDTTCEAFNSKFIEFAEKNIPKKSITVRTKDKPWFNSELRLAIRKRERLRQKALKGSLIARERYIIQRNHVNNMKKHAKQSFYCDIHGLVDQYASNNQKDFWKLVKRIIRSNDNSINIPPLLNPTTSELVIDDKGKANVLNSYFSSISTVDSSDNDIPHFECRTNNKINNIQIRSEDIVDIIKTLKTNKASGMDKISHIMLKNTINTVCIPLLLLFNKSLELHIFPAPWKIARIMPIFKKGDEHNPSNYRPISLLSTVGKLFERIIHKHIYNFMIDNNLIYKLQSGFLPNNSTVYQLLEIYHNICMNQEENKKNLYGIL